jgi:hypothetical protein
MALLDVVPDPSLQLVECSPLRDPGEDGVVNVLGRVPAGFANDNAIALLAPLQHRPRPDAQTLPDLGRNRDLTLSREFRVSYCHTDILPR